MYWDSYYDICIEIPQSLTKDMTSVYYDYGYYPLVIQKIFENPEFVSNIFSIIEKGNKQIKIGHKFDNQRDFDGKTYSINRFVNIVNEMVESGQIKKDENVKKLLQLTSISNLIKQEQKSKSNFSIVIEGKNYCIDSYDILKLFYGNKDYDKLLDKFDYVCLKYNLDYDELAYAMKQYAEKNKIFDKYYFEEYDMRFYKQIKGDQIFDTSYINQVPETNDPFLDQTFLNQDLVDYIFSDMSEDYSLLEKSIYVYIQLCKTLTYDAEFFAHKQSGKKARIHEDITRLSQITPSNNGIVCYEFSQIYGKFLDELGIKFENTNDFGSYGLTHASVIYKIGKFLVSADSVTHIIGGDLYNAKVHETLEGLKLMSNNPTTLNEFLEAYEKVYNDIKKQEPIYRQQLSKDLLNAYQNLSEPVEISIEDKIDMLEEKLKLSKFKPIDVITFVEKNIKKIAQTEFKNGQLNVCICNKKVGATFDDLLPIIVIEYSKNAKYDKDTKYFEFDTKTNSFEIHSQATMQREFNKENYLYIGPCSQRLKGIQNEYRMFFTI